MLVFNNYFYKNKKSKLSFRYFCRYPKRLPLINRREYIPMPLFLSTIGHCHGKFLIKIVDEQVHLIY
jgi:hypothetical protein